MEDTSMELAEHLGHEISILKAQDVIIQIKCLNCNKVLGYNLDSIDEIEDVKEE